MLRGLRIKATGDLRDFICVPAPLAPRKGLPAMYENVTVELEKRIATMCQMVAEYPTFIIGAWGCGFFGNKLEDVEKLFLKYATNETVVMAVK